MMLLINNLGNPLVPSKLRKTKFYRPVLSILLSCWMLSGCSDVETDPVLSFKVETGDFIVKIPGVGELEAAKSTSINMPAGIFESQVLSWVAEENQLVKKGEVVIRFDALKYQHESEQENFQIQKADVGYDAKQKGLKTEEDEIEDELKLIKEELTIAGRYTVDDLRVYSRNEIIEAMKNQAYLESKKNYTDWRGASHENKSAAELELLHLKRGQHSAKLGMYTNMLNQLEITAPHDGIFVLERNWRGDKARVGDLIWPGRKIASLPDLAKIQARIFILESEAVGIKVGQSVELVLDAYPEQSITGKLQQIDSIAKPRNNKSPVKYFEAVVEINQESIKQGRPGSQLRASILAANRPQTISIPSQAIEFEDDSYYVLLNDKSRWRKQFVKIGTRNSAMTEIIEGLADGDQVALFKPPNINLADSKHTEIKEVADANQ